MASIGPEGFISELPQAWRRVAYAALLAVSLTAGYFLFIAGPIANASDAIKTTNTRVDKVEADISTIKGDVSEIRTHQAANDQKLDDVKGSVDAINQKLDRLLLRGK